MVLSQLQQFFTRVMTDQGDRVASAMSEYARVEQKGAEQARVAADEWSRLAQASMTYGLELSEQWRKLSLEATRRTFDLMTPASKTEAPASGAGATPSS